MHAPNLLTQTAIALLALAMVRPGYANGMAATAVTNFSGPIVTSAGALHANGVALTPPVAALQAGGMPGDGIHALGFVPDPAALPPPASFYTAPTQAGLPTMVDLSLYNPPVGDQGGIGSCVSWATGYYLRGWYAKRDGYYPAGGTTGTGSFAPMFLYSQLVRGQNVGTYFKDNLTILQQGIDTRADYVQGDYDFADLPTPNEAATASHYRLASFNDVSGPHLQQWIETTIAGGNPVAIGIPAYPEFDHATASNPLVGLPQPTEHSRGGHAVFASMYDANGLWIENSWGTAFGLHGYVELSWNFVNQYASEAVNEIPVLPGASVPDVRGELPRQGADTIRAAGFAVALTSAVDRTCNNLGRIMWVHPSWAVFGSTITLTVGSRPRTPCP